MVLITAPPGMGKSRASEEIHTQLVLRGHFVIYVKLSQIISFWIKCDENPSVKAFLQECMDDDKFQKRPEGNKMIVVLDGFDEVCPLFRSEAIALINKLLLGGTKVLITSRPQEKDEIITGLKQEVDMFIVEIEPFFLDQKVMMLQTKLNLGVNR
jgi:predicted NACHT family NTPase